MKTEVVVVGAGPCGVAAAIQLKRSGVPFLLVEKRAVGGLLHNANLVENYPGLPGGVPGPSLCLQLESHLLVAGIQPLLDEVVELNAQPDGYELETISGQKIRATAVVLATGTVPIRGIVPGEEPLIGKRIFYEVREVLLSASGRRVAILGGGDAAYDYALNLASKDYTVYILQRSRARCLPLLEARAREQAAISIVQGVHEISLSGGEDRITLNFKGERLDADYLLIACGRIPADPLLRQVAAKEGDLPRGLFTGGDLVRGSFRQAGIAVGDGLVAAMAAARYLSSLKGNTIDATHP